MKIYKTTISIIYRIVMKSSPLFLIVASLMSCSENPTQPEDTTIKYYNGENSIDINGDGLDDVRWELRHIVNQTSTAVMFTVIPVNGSELLYNTQNGNPPFAKGDTINFSGVQPLNWYSLSMDLSSKRTNTGQWQGNWAGINAYMPIKFLVDDNFHCGWVNTTMDTLNEKIIFNYSDYQQNAGEDFIITD